jgi:hypothetical protein
MGRRERVARRFDALAAAGSKRRAVRVNAYPDASGLLPSRPARLLPATLAHLLTNRFA